MKTKDVPPTSAATTKKTEEVDAKDVAILQAAKELQLIKDAALKLVKANKADKEKLMELGLSEIEANEILAEAKSGGPAKMPPTPASRAAEDEKKIKDLEAQTNAMFAQEQKEKGAISLDGKMKEIGLSELDFSKMPKWAELSYGTA